VCKYSSELKLEIVRAYIDGDIGARALAKKYAIDDHKLRQWTRLYNPRIGRSGQEIQQKGGIEALKPRATGRRKAMVDPKGKPPPKEANDRQSREEVLAELSQLRMENAYLKKLNALVQARQAPIKRK
jgi:transposase